MEKDNKLAAFMAAMVSAAETEAAEVRSDAAEEEAAALEECRAGMERDRERRIAAAEADARSQEDKRVTAAAFAAKHELLRFREDCADEVFAAVRERIRQAAAGEGYGAMLRALLEKALAALRGAESETVYLRAEDMGQAGGLKAAFPGVELDFAEGEQALGGLIAECPQLSRRADLTFDSALEDLEGRFAETTGFSMEM